MFSQNVILFLKFIKVLSGLVRVVECNGSNNNENIVIEIIIQTIWLEYPIFAG